MQGKRPATDSVDAPSPAWLFFIGLLLAARYLQPTEAAVFGETLWQAQLWLIGAAVWCWFTFRSGRGTLSFSWLDVIVGLIVLGHVLSSIPIFMEGGDRRSALNIVWEWAGLAATLVLVRQLLPYVGSTRLLSVVTSVLVGIAALGIWQYHVAFQETAVRYDELIARESELAKRAVVGDTTELQRRELADVRRELNDFGIPTDAAARRQWENRIKFSSEPFGTFGLANTLGGLLAAAIPVLLSRLSSFRGWRLGALVTAIVAVLYCLLLTKSRTAWVGLAVGGAVAFALHFARSRLERRTLIAVASILLFVAVAGVVVLASGGLDREVLSEAPKSLQYRLDYWTGSLGVLSERPILGTGPANFRSHYLEHRPVGASEEIAAPHNLFLDIWTAGGLLSLMSLCALLLKSASDVVRVRDVDVTVVDALPSPAVIAGVASAFAVTFVVFFLSGDGLDWRLIAMAPLAVAIVTLQDFSNGSSAAGVGVVAGLIALIVHLLGADGIEFPAVLQTLLLFSLALDRPRWVVVSHSSIVAAAAVCGLMAAGCLLTGIVPVLNRGALTARASAAIAAGDPTADRLLDEAIAADSLANTPLMLRAELASARAVSGARRTADVLDARRNWLALLEQDPRNLAARQRLAQLLLTTGSERDAEEAATLLKEAVALSPTDSQLRVDASRALEAAGQTEAAAEQAAAALRLDDVNRAAGHTDILLDDMTRSAMEAAVGNAAAVP